MGIIPEADALIDYACSRLPGTGRISHVRIIYDYVAGLVQDRLENDSVAGVPFSAPRDN